MSQGAGREVRVPRVRCLSTTGSPLAVLAVHGLLGDAEPPRRCPARTTPSFRAFSTWTISSRSVSARRDAMARSPTSGSVAVVEQQAGFLRVLGQGVRAAHQANPGWLVSWLLVCDMVVAGWWTGWSGGFLVTTAIAAGVCAGPR